MFLLTVCLLVCAGHCHGGRILQLGDIGLGTKDRSSFTFKIANLKPVQIPNLKILVLFFFLFCWLIYYLSLTKVFCRTSS